MIKKVPMHEVQKEICARKRNVTLEQKGVLRRRKTKVKLFRGWFLSTSIWVWVLFRIDHSGSHFFQLYFTYISQSLGITTVTVTRRWQRGRQSRSTSKSAASSCDGMEAVSKARFQSRSLPQCIEVTWLRRMHRGWLYPLPRAPSFLVYSLVRWVQSSSWFIHCHRQSSGEHREWFHCLIESDEAPSYSMYGLVNTGFVGPAASPSRTEIHREDIGRSMVKAQNTPEVAARRFHVQNSSKNALH